MVLTKVRRVASATRGFRGNRLNVLCGGKLERGHGGPRYHLDAIHPDDFIFGYDYVQSLIVPVAWDDGHLLRGKP